ncbi:MAG: radical SAM protein [Chthoniobacteraceae bacterium]|nr:radical SAM protein [Chthoniobacteraceae bacterium]
MFLSLALRALRTVDLRLLLKFGWNFGVKNLIAVERFKRRLRRGDVFPPFLQLSLLNSCNLRCQGCWVDVDGPRHQLELPALNRLIEDAKRQGNAFFGLLGGEPFLHPGLFDLLAAHPDCYFQIFTNGQSITEEAAQRLRKLGNATVLVSIEGGNVTSADTRRGGHEVLDRSLRGLEYCLRARLITGVATSLCQTNIDDLLNERWLRELIARDVHYVWYYTYRPVGPRHNPQLALGPEQIARVRRFVVEMRAKLPIGIVDCYYDHDGVALCPAVTGASHHVNPRGDIEPCPLIQFATDRIDDPRGLYETIRSSPFLSDFRAAAAAATRGCVLLERPDVVRALVEKHHARDTTLRGTALAELDAMQPRPSQAMTGHEVPERSWMYRFAKKYWFNDFGAYRNGPKD